MVARYSASDRLLSALRTRRLASARELGSALSASQPSISRWLAGAGDQIVRIGQARSSRYAAVRNVRGLGDRWPLYRIDGNGQPLAFARLTAMHGGGCLIAMEKPPDWLRDEFSEGVFPGLPWFLDDMRPQGFLGRLFAQRCAHELGLDPDILRWDEDTVLAALLLRGADGPGNFVLGEQALDQALRATPDPIPSSQRAERYAALAQATLAGERIGSSAAGEQPKFTAGIEEADGTVRHVIVKFTERIEGNPVSRRWADLLICEYLASRLLDEHGHAGARDELVWSRGQLCLESTRFDRAGTHGRRGFVSLAAWSDAHDGLRDSWPDAAERMRRGDWLGVDAVGQITQRWWFGRMIGNTDMHFGNLGFFLDGALPLQLAPSYDMLPMLYRPAANGSIVPREYQPPTPLPASLPYWQQAATWAGTFWQRVAAHPEVSADFRRIANDNQARLASLRQRFGAK
jgi:Uncharacterized protein related to capsule biosynthesis enzymes